LFGEAGQDLLVGDGAGLDIAYHGKDYLDGGEDGDTLLGMGVVIFCLAGPAMIF
jgi:hypothetical protein